MHETYMNFMFRLESNTQDIPRVYVDIPNLEKKIGSSSIPSISDMDVQLKSSQRES